MEAGVMYLLTSVLVFGICSTSALNLWEIIDLKAVTFSEGTLEYYHTARIQKSGDPPQEVSDPGKRADIKKRICRNVFTSLHFKTVGPDWVDVDDRRIRKELHDNLQYRAIFESIFVETSMAGDYEYENAYQERPYHSGVHGDPGNEYVFTCPARNRSTRKIGLFFVTQEYNVNENPAGAPMAGRFIFEIDENQRLQIRGMAEEGALRFRLSSVPYLADMEYLKSRLNDISIYTTPNQDPVCRLSDSNRVRLCTSLFSSDDFKGKVTFLPTINYVRNGCESVDISIASYTFLFFTFLLGFIRPSEALSLPYENFKEWTVGCYALTHTGAEVVFHVARGNMGNTIYVYTESEEDDEELLMYNLYYNVSVVGEVDDDGGPEPVDNEPQRLLDTDQRPENDGEVNESMERLLTELVRDFKNGLMYVNLSEKQLAYESTIKE